MDQPKEDLEQLLDMEVEKAGGSSGPHLLDSKMEEAAGSASDSAPPGAALAQLPLHPESFRDNALAILSDELKRWYGPAQYLRAKYNTPEAREKFAEALDLAFPARGELWYNNGSDQLPDELDTVFPVRMSALSFAEEASAKPSPFLDVSLLLLDEFLTNTFQSKHDPLLLAQGPKEDHFWTRFVKGSARACTLLFLASEVMIREWNLSTLAPELLHSMTVVFCKRGIMTSDPQSIALENAKLSQKGSIRRAHCVLTWLGKLSLLQKHGLSPDQVIKLHNQTATQSGQLTGSKRVAVLALLNMPSKCTQVLLQHLSMFGDHTAFYEDAFSNKRLAVGAKARAGSKVWNDRLHVSQEGLLMMLQYIDAQHKKKLPGTHTKLRKETLEEILNMAQLLVSLCAELVAQHPIQHSLLEEKAPCHKCI